MGLDDVLKEVLRRVTPTKEERERIREVSDALVRMIRERGGSFVDVIVAGSAARDTNLRGSSDIDIFVLYPRDVPRDVMEKEVLGFADLLERAETRYAEHPYVHGTYRGVDVDIVPAYVMKPGERIKSATDRTPLHQRFLEERLNDELRAEIRLLKAFMKGIGTYGAEIKVQGFSGYLCELLILKYGSFVALLKEAAHWKPPVFVDLGVQPKKRFKDPLIVVDPVDPYRNVAAPVSLHTLSVFVAAAREFLVHPSLVFFFPERAPLPREELKRILLSRRTEIVTVLLPYPEDISPDIVWGEIRAFLEYLKRHIRAQGYHVMNAACWTDERTRITFVLEVDRVPVGLLEKRMGPPVFDEEHSKRFLEKHREKFFGPWIENGRWWVEVERGYLSLPLAVEEVIRNAERSGAAPRHVDFSKLLVLPGQAVLEFYGKDKAFDLFLTSFLLKRPPWLKRQ